MARRGFLTTLLLVGGLTGASCYFIVTELAANHVQSLPAGLMFLIGSLLFSVRWIRYYFGIRRTYRDVTSQTRTRWLITDERLLATSETFTLTFDWAEINRTIFRDEALILVYQKTQAFTLPRRFFVSEDDWRQVLAWAREKRN